MLRRINIVRDYRGSLMNDLKLLPVNPKLSFLNLIVVRKEPLIMRCHVSLPFNSIEKYEIRLIKSFVISSAYCFAEGLSSIPSIHFRQVTAFYSFSSRDRYHHLTSAGIYSQVHITTHRRTYIHMIEKQNILKLGSI